MRLPVKARDLPARIATGGYILHSGLEKWHGDETRAKALHGVASNAFPVLQQIPPERFLRIFAPAVSLAVDMRAQSIRAFRMSRDGADPVLVPAAVAVRSPAGALPARTRRATKSPAGSKPTTRARR